MADIVHQAGIQGQPEQIYQVLTTEDGLKSWWSEHSSLQPGVGSLATVSFYNNMVTFELRVKELVENEKVVWAVEGGPPNWADTEITWTIGEDQMGPFLHFAHRGFESMEDNFASINYNWGWYLTSIKFLVEKGEGWPHTDADLM